MEDEGELIDGYLRHLKEAPNPLKLSEYVLYLLFCNNEDYNAQIKVERKIKTRIEQYGLVDFNGQKYVINGLGCDVIDNGGYAKWRQDEDKKAKKLTKQQDGIYTINKVLALTAVLSLIFSLYQIYTNNQIELKIKDLVRQDSTLKKQDSLLSQKLKTIMLPSKTLKKHKE